MAAGKLNKEALEAAIAETLRWDTGSTSRAGRPVEYHVLRMGDDGHYDIVSVHDNRAACDKSSERRVLGAAISAYLAKLPAPPPTAEVELRAEVVEMCCAVVEEARFLSAPEMDLITDAIRDKFTALSTADREGKRDAPR